ncbi:hypothetical protein COT62_00190 [Candidatus Roizmanbacteria bacterium CG09_land_8_20_14_0_10_41_9]|uniref:Fibronectin type-III domain-containing protein n=1 Tax=Candidatus Roizmanbacteria bacterium CG09_land_8_20_14_0_10_41_9 TaxID=1974850 RepID=A0A2H0WTV2_9BACT|nr:MAG: hypothetical protein COT62_00190 [Candidatus Roizmanbacteria bacterium CG09_land_8_20_14_0_10_41_9]
MGSRLYNNGTPSGTTVVNGFSGKARQNSISSYISVPDNSSLEPTNVTVEAWVYRTADDADWQTITAKVYSTSSGADSYYLGFYNNILRFYTYNGATDDYLDSRVIDNNAWHHVAATFDGSTKKIYIDGNLANQNAWNQTIAYGNGPLGIGNDQNSGSWATDEGFVGTLDEVRISNIARTADEIAESYRAGRDHHFSKTISSTDLSTKTKVPFWIASDRQGTFLETTVGESSFANYEPDANTVGLWKLEDENSLIASDSTGNSNNGFMNQDQILHTQYDGIVGHPTDHAGLLADFTPTTLYVKEINNSINVPSQSLYDQRDNMYSTWLNVKYAGTWSFAVDGDDAVEVEVDGVVVGGYYGAHGFCSCQTYGGTISLTAGWHKLIARHEEDGGGEGIIVYYKDPDDAAWSILTSANLAASATLHASLPTDAYVSTSTYISNGLAYPNFIVQGKIGKARSFNGGSDSVYVNSSLISTNQDFTMSAFFYPRSWSSSGCGPNQIMTNVWFIFGNDSGTGFNFGLKDSTFTWREWVSTTLPSLNTWHHVVGVRENNYLILYMDGKFVGKTATNLGNTAISNVYIGGSHCSAYGFDGYLDEVRIDKVARSALDIRQAYEIGRRTHPITIDFKAKLDGSNLIADSSDLSFIVDGTGYGASIKGAGIYVEDKIIVKENYNGTEYIAQGTVSSVTASTGAVSVISWDAGSTFPTGGQTGFSANATVFKWQREYFDLTGITTGVGGTDPVNQRNAVNRLTFRVTDGSEGANIWLDDMRYSDAYLTNFLGSTIPSSLNRYFQYRTILSSNDTQVSPSLSSVTLDYIQNSPPNLPVLEAPTAPGNTNISLSPTLKTRATDDDLDYLRYKIELATDSIFTQNLQTFTQPSGSPQTGWTQQDAESGTAYASGTQAAYTLQTLLSPSTTYYWRTYAVDPDGRNIWSSTQSPAGSFDTTNPPTAPTLPFCQGGTSPTRITTTTPQFSAIHNDPDSDSANYYQIEVNTQSGFGGTIMWDSGKTSMSSLASGSRSSNVTYNFDATGTPLTLDGSTYYWRIKFWDTNLAVGSTSATQQFTLNAPPSAPTSLLTNGSSNPSNVTDFTPYFSAIYNDLDVGDTATSFQLQVNTNSGFSGGTMMWDSLKVGLTNPLAQGARSPNINYGGSTLHPGETYYLRFKFWDALDVGGTWSSETAFFTMEPLNTPSYCTLSWNPTGTEITIDWDDLNSIETGYRLQKNEGGAGFQDFTSPNPLAADTVTYLDTVTPGVEYQYRVRAEKDSDYGSWCTSSSATPDIKYFKMGGVRMDGIKIE